MDDNLITWLANELKNRGWSHRELARRSNLSQTAISTVLSGQRQPGWEFCAAIARALGEAPEKVFRRAGLLPALPAPEDDATLRELVEYTRQLSREERTQVLQYAQWRYQQEQQRRKGDRDRKAPRSSAAGTPPVES